MQDRKKRFACAQWVSKGGYCTEKALESGMGLLPRPLHTIPTISSRRVITTMISFWQFPQFRNIRADMPSYRTGSFLIFFRCRLRD